MAKQKYQIFYDLMREQNKKAFDAFQPIHDQFAKDGKNEEEFHSKGVKILDIVRDWDRRLCSGMERGTYAGYSSKLSEKFWSRVKEDLPLVEEIGVKVTKKN